MKTSGNDSALMRTHQINNNLFGVLCWGNMYMLTRGGERHDDDRYIGREEGGEPVALTRITVQALSLELSDNLLLCI